MSRFAGDCQFEEHRVFGITRKLECDANDPVFICDISQLVQCHRNPSWRQRGETREDRRVKQDGMVFPKHGPAQKWNRFAG